jgi:hypothetical protein
MCILHKLILQLYNHPLPNPYPARKEYTIFIIVSLLEKDYNKQAVKSQDT